MIIFLMLMTAVGYGVTLYTAYMNYSRPVVVGGIGFGVFFC